MGIARGPNIVKDDLVFGYDTGYGIADNDTATRFYSGRPTTNYLSSGVSGYNVVQGAAWHGATPSYTLGTSEFGTPIGTYNVGGSNYMYSYDQVLDDDLSTLSSQTVTFSIYLKRDGVDSNVRIRIYDNVSGYTYSTKSVTSKFSRYTMTKTLGANPTRIFVMIDNTGGGLIDFHSPQLEIGDVSPFVDGTRSATASLIDLKRATNIDVSNVSFDSTGQTDFDGTSDFMVLGDFDLRPGFTLETVCYPESTSFAVWGQGPTAANRGLHIIATGGGRGFVYGMYGNDCDYQLFPTTNAWHHWVFTYDGTSFQKKFFANGVAQTPSGNTVQNEWIEGSSALRLGTNYGSGTSYGKANGKIAVAKYYNKPLSDAEIKQNYNAYKNRFDI